MWKTIAKSLLCIVLLTLLLVGLTVLAWWKEWPLLTGVAVVVALVAFYLLFLGGRALWRLNNKRRFVRQVMAEQSAQDQSHQQAAQAVSRLENLWQAGGEFLNHSTMRFQRRAEYAQPWYLLLDASSGETTLHPALDTLGQNVPPQYQDDDPLRWHFLPQAVLLHCPWRQAAVTAADAGDGGEAWQELLTLLAKRRPERALNGVVLLLDASRLVAETNFGQVGEREELTRFGEALRLRLQSLMLTLNQRLPVYVLVCNMQAVRGFSALSGRLENAASALLQEQALGSLCSQKTQPDELTAAVEAQLLRVVHQVAAQGEAPRGDDFTVFSLFKRINKQLGRLGETWLRANPHQTTPRLRGVFYCAGQAENASTQLPFLAPFFNRVLAAEPSLNQALAPSFSLKASSRILLYAAWLTLLLAWCGLVAVDGLYQNRALMAATNPDPIHFAQVDSIPKEIQSLYQRMTVIRTLENAERNWWLPHLGVNAVGDRLRELKNQYTADTVNQLIAPIFIRDHRAELRRADDSQEQQVNRVLLNEWLDRMIKDRLQGKLQAKIDKNQDATLPLTKRTEAIWSPVTGEILRSAVQWTQSNDDLALLHNELLNQILTTISSSKEGLLKVVLNLTENSLQANDVCLSTFWQHIVPGSDADRCVSPIYTKKVADYLANLMNQVVDHGDQALGDDMNGANGSELHRISEKFTRDYQEYQQNYAKVWHEFIYNFSNAWKDVHVRDAFSRYSNIRSIKDMPHLQLLFRVSEETEPLRRHGANIAWVDGIERFNLLVKMQMAVDQKVGEGDLQSLFNIAFAAPELLVELRRHVGSVAELRKDLELLKKINVFFGDIRFAVRSLNNPVQSLLIVQPFFAGTDFSKAGQFNDDDADNNDDKDGGEKAPRNSYYRASEGAKELLAVLRGGEDSPNKFIMRSMLDFLAHGLTVQAGNEIQRQWEDEVLDKAAFRLHRDDAEALFGDSGVVQQFVGKQLNPFLRWQGNDPSANTWNDIVFPLTDDFLKGLRQGEQALKFKPKDEYQILLRLQPTLVNAEARERPNVTRFVLNCGTEKIELLNRNYPQEKVFLYKPQSCGEMTLSIEMPSFSLSKTFASFGEFLHYFQYGEVTLDAEDFPQQAESLKKAAIHSLRVRVLPDNTNIFLGVQEHHVPAMPERITYTW